MTTQTLKYDLSQVFPLRILRRDEAQSALVVGDIGAGKSTFQRGIIMQAITRGDAVIIHDPHREFTEEFYRDDVDWILNPLDLRFPYWSPGEEVEQNNEPDGLMIGQSLYPLTPGDQPFFIRQASTLFAFLISHYQPTGRQLGDWMANDTIIDRLVKGTEFERTLTKDSAGQRSGIIAVLNTTGPAFRMLPDGASRHFSVKEWVQKREGNIFITNTLNSRAALRPLQSMWIDLIIARIISMGPRKDLPFVWMVLDELASLQHLPQLKVAITENRKAGLSVVVGFHGKSQIEAIYGKDSDTIFAQAKTKVILRTNEPDAAEWASRMIGDVEIERAKESRPAHKIASGGRGHSYSTEKRIERLVMASEIQNLKDLHGYFRYQDICCPVHFAYLPRFRSAEPFIPAPVRSRWDPDPSVVIDVEAQPETAANPGVVDVKAEAETSVVVSGKPSPEYGMSV